MKDNSTKAKLRAGQAVFGAFLRYPSAGLVEFLGHQGWDFFIFDAEHGPTGHGDCEHMIRAAELTGVTPLVRVPCNRPDVILRYLDLGAQGIQVPWINSAADAQDAVRAIKYQPQGVRGLASARAADYGQRDSFADYIRKANAETLVVVQMESQEAVDNIEAIAAAPGVDVLFIGPLDLSNSLGLPGEVNHPKVREAMKRITDGVTKSGKTLGIVVSNADGAKVWLDQGARYVTTTFEAVAGPACRAFLKGAKGS